MKLIRAAQVGLERLSESLEARYVSAVEQQDTLSSAIATALSVPDDDLRSDITGIILEIYRSQWTIDWIEKSTGYDLRSYLKYENLKREIGLD